MSKRLLLLGLAISSLICSGYSYRGECSHATIEVSEDYINETEDFGTIMLDGKYIKIPCKVQLLIDIGYTVESEYDRVLPAESESYGVRLYDTNGRVLTLFVRNDEKEDRDVGECMAWAVLYEPIDDAKYGYLDFAISGVRPDASENIMVEKLGLPDSNMDVSGVNYVMWSTPKDEYTVAIDYSSEGILQMKLTSDVPAKELGNALSIQWEAEEDSGDIYTEPEIEESNGVGVKVLLFLFIGIPVLIVLIVAVVIVVYLRLKHKREMAEINLAILNTSIEDIEDKDLEEIYKE